MPLSIACPACGLTGHVPDGFASPQVNCPRCGLSVPINHASAGNGSTSAGPPATASLSTPADLRANLVDAFFAQAFNPRPAAPTGPTPVPLPPRPTLSVPPSDPGAEQQWLKEERQRLEDYLSKQFGLLQHRREELAAWQSRIEAALIAREQELNRLQKQLTSQEETLKLREASVAALSSELSELEAKAAQLRSQIADLQTLTDSKRAEADQLSQTAATARTEIQQLQELSAAHEGRLEQWRQRMQQLERRQVALEKAEQALQRRSTEWQELEDQVRRELEQREQGLARERQLLDERWAQQGADGDANPVSAQEAASPQLEEMIAQLRQELAQQQALADSKQAEAEQQRQRELADSRRVLAERTEQLKAAQKDNESMRVQVGRLTAELEQLRRPPSIPPQRTAPTIEFACSQCGMKIKVKSEFAGRSSRCPTCKQPLVVPAAAATTGR